MVSESIGFFLAMSIIGIWNWGKSDTKNITREKAQIFILILSIITIGTLIIARIFLEHPQQMDLIILLLSIYATYLMIQKYLESWLVWITVDVLSIILFIDLGDWFMVFNYLIFLLISLKGYNSWKKLMV